MLKIIKISVKDTLVYSFGNISVKIIGLFLIPLYTDPEYFTVDQFGVLGMMEITGLVLAAFLASTVPQSLTRWYWDREHTDNQKGIFFMSFTTQVATAVLLCILLIPLSGRISELIFGKTDWESLIMLVILAAGTQAVNNIVNTLMRLQSKSVLYTVVNLVKLIFVFALTLFFILHRKMGLNGIYLAQLAGNILFIFILAGYIKRNSKLYFDKPTFREMNVFGFPLLLANISAVILNVIDRYSLNSLAALSFVAIYTLAFKVTSVLKLVIADSIKLAIAPMMMKNMGSPDNTRFYSKVLLYSSYVMMAGIIGVSMFSLEVIKVIAKSPEFRSAVSIIPVLALSVFFMNMKDVTIYGLHIAKRSKIIGLIVVFSTVLGLAFNLTLIPLWDIKGAAIATLLTQCVYWYACYYFAQRSFYIPYENRKLLILFLCGSALSFSSLLINEMHLVPRLVIKTASLISFPFILYLFNFYEPQEIKAIRGFAAKWSDLRKFRENLNSLKDLKE